MRRRPGRGRRRWLAPWMAFAWAMVATGWWSLWPTLAGAAELAAAAPIEVATYNLRLDLASDGPNAWPHRRDAVKALIRYHGIDLLGTQEGLVNQIRDLEQMDEFARVGVGRDDGREGGEFAAIFYRKARFTVLAHGDFWLSTTPDRPSMGWDARCCKRLATWARLRDSASGQDFAVFSVHFDHEGEVARRESARLMLRKIDELAPGLPVLCLGDFNSTPETEQIRTMTSRLGDARQLSLAPPYGPVGTFNDFRLDAPMLERIDYIFVSPGVRVLKYAVLSDSIDRRYPSDHHPVVARVALGRASPPALAVQSWTTTGDRSRLLARETGLGFADVPTLPVHIEVDAAQRFQTMVGFGASITDASAWLIRNRMSEPQRAALMSELFGRGPDGVGFEFTRLTIGASDFSRSHYSFDDLPPGQTDMALERFSIEPSRADVLPVVRQALAVNPRLKVMASPWSAPGWMKTSDSLVKGALRPDRYEVFSRYLLRYVEAYAAEGVPIFALTVQNEPHFEPSDYPGMRVDATARAALIGQHLGPLLAQRAPQVQIIEWDHNWDEPQAPLTVLADPVARPYVAGVGWHCYVSESLLKNQSVVHDAHPDKDAWLTECSGGEWKPEWSERLPWTVRHLVIGATRGWARGVQMWNLALDEKHGPHLGGCTDCRGVVTIDSRTGAVTRNLEYYALAHASKFVRQGARRIASTAVAGPLETVAFRNADDGSIALVICNAGPSEQRYSVRSGGRVLQASIPRESIVTLVWTPEA